MRRNGAIPKSNQIPKSTTKLKQIRIYGNKRCWLMWETSEMPLSLFFLISFAIFHFVRFTICWTVNSLKFCFSDEICWTMWSMKWFLFILLARVGVCVWYIKINKLLWISNVNFCRSEMKKKPQTFGYECDLERTSHSYHFTSLCKFNIFCIFMMCIWVFFFCWWSCECCFVSAYFYQFIDGTSNERTHSK